MERFLPFLKKILPKAFLEKTLPVYHKVLPLLGAIIYRFPSRNIFVIGVTGTKGKTTVTELIYRVLNQAGYKVTLSNTIHFIIEEKEERNLFKMTMPGRMFLQKFLRRAVDAGCQFAIIEMSSEGAKLYRHHHIQLDAFIFTNLTPEHIEAHGSFEAYKAAKLRIRDALVYSRKKNKLVVVNRDDSHSEDFARVPDAKKLSYSIRDVAPSITTDRGSLFTYKGVSVHTPLKGTFNIENALAVITLTEALGVPFEKIKKTLETLKPIAGRVEEIVCGQNFSVFVDYAHTKESLEALYRTFPNKRKICVLGNCGGGRDRWKRPEMGAIADTYCDEIILTNEDPYDEDPRVIIEEMTTGFKTHTPLILLDRKKAIRKALSLARAKDVVLITGKGTDPYIMEAEGKKTPWSDAEVVREELERLLKE